MQAVFQEWGRVSLAPVLQKCCVFLCSVIAVTVANLKVLLNLAR